MGAGLTPGGTSYISFLDGIIVFTSCTAITCRETGFSRSDTPYEEITDCVKS
jgi:hypothetical protein